MFFKLLILSICLKATVSFYNGAPAEACQTLRPTHGDQLPIPIPVRLDLSSTVVRAGYPFPFQIVSLPDTVFGDFMYRGFIIQARSAAGAVLGTFDVTTGAQHIACPGLATGSTITHIHNNDRNTQSFIWRAPPYNQFPGAFINVQLHFSIVMNVGMFWHAQSGIIRVENPNVALNQTIVN